MITTQCANFLRLRRHKSTTTLRTIGNARGASPRAQVLFHLHHHGDPPRLPITAEVMDCISAAMPSSRIQRWDYFKDCELADPTYHLPKPVDILLGADALPFLLKNGSALPLRGAPAALETTLGWVLYGPCVPPRRHTQARFEPTVSPTTSLQSNFPQRSSRRHRRSSPPSSLASQLRTNSAVPTLTLPSAISPSSSFADSSGRQRATSPDVPSVIRTASPQVRPVKLRKTGDSIGLSIIASEKLGQEHSGMRLHPNDTTQAQGVDPLVEIVRRFWELDQVQDRVPYTPDEQRCENIYADTVRRSPSGRYVTTLPFASNPTLGISFNVATRQFLRLEQRLARQPALQSAYAAFMKDYLDSGHMELVNSGADSSIPEPYYIPHHPVHRPDDPPTKLRVVFNASCASSNGKSLNDLLFTGPKLQADIDTLLLRFRIPPIVFTCDIRQMYRQILISPAQRDYQRIIWRFSSAEPLQSYRLNTITYGVSTAPFLALRTLLQLAKDEALSHPEAAKVLENDVYVDDVLTGAETADKALILRKEIQRLLMAGGFELRKWATNYPPLLEGIPVDHLRSSPQGSASPELLLDKDPVIKILGLGWNPVSDNFFYSVRLGTPSTTKRTILSQMARIFDPLGWLTPITFQTKLFFRHLCQLGVDWDQLLSPSLLSTWDEFQSQLHSLSDLQIPRLLPAANDQSIHHLVGFCDASESGYAAVVYLHTTSVEGVTTSTLVAAKSKVAPLKKVTLPRLELCGAHLLARVLHNITTRMLPQWRLPVVAYCDSTVTLAWIHGESHRWQTFVGNRVAAIQELTSPSSWFHVISEDNPADCASRGLMPQCLIAHPLWWHGPPWLAAPKSLWPLSKALVKYSSDDVIAEEKTPAQIVLLNTVPEPGLESRFSSLHRMQRVLAYCRRFMYNACRSRRSSDKRTGHLSSVELQDSLICVIRRIQHHEFPLERMEAANPSSRHRMVRQLHLFLDEQDILRVGGRLSASSLTYSQKHPIFLPKRHHFTSLIIDNAHIRLLHAGALATHAHLRQRFWIPDGRNVVRLRLRQCNRCFTCKPRPIIQPMGNLPKERSATAGAFVTTGVDYAGPFSLSSARLRGSTVTKAYLVVFICFSTKAVHLEVASNLTSGAFIAAYRRFAARRGHSSVIFSDNGTNFVGAHTELRDLGKLLRSTAHQTLVADVATSSGTDWRFIPPSSPHFGGLWEAAVKSAKHHLKRVIGEQLLTYEEFLTVCSQVEAILNSRPLIAPSSDPTDLDVLTPGHFLIGRPLTTPPDPNLASIALNRLSRWQLVQRIQQDLWKRWQHEYLHTLQQRTKWLTSSTDIQPGTVVLIKEDNLPPLRWSVGRISTVFPGPDGVVRVADVFTPSGTLRRPVAKLCPLPTQ